MEPRRLLVRDLRAGDVADQVFLVRDKDFRRTPAGASYSVCRLSDRTGTVEARWWKADREAFSTIPLHGFARVKGRVENYRGQLQFHIQELEPVEGSPEEVQQFMPRAEQDVDEMWEQLCGHVLAVENPHLLRLVKKVVDDAELAAQFRSAPAATQIHHNVVGGLLAHTLSVVRLARAVAAVYGPEKLNADLVVVGALLHDIGKLEELEAKGTFAYTDRGNLVGHIACGTIWVQRKAEEIAAETGEPFPPAILDLVQHLILSHHGTHAQGSPKQPMIPEAFVLHALDNLDARVEITTVAIAGDRDEKSSFTNYQRTLDSRLYKKVRDALE